MDTYKTSLKNKCLLFETLVENFHRTFLQSLSEMSKKLKISSNFQYFNLRILVINRKKWRTNNISLKMTMA
jgi:lipopolysaccharide biosynthesis glycosyltransferase